MKSSLLIFAIAASFFCASCETQRSLAQFGDFKVSAFGDASVAAEVPPAAPAAAPRPAAADRGPVIVSTDPVVLAARAQAAAPGATPPPPLPPQPSAVLAGHAAPSLAQASSSAAPAPQAISARAATAPPLRGSIPKNFVVRTTAYTHTEPDHIEYGKKSALGEELKFGRVRSAAADWSRYPVGTRFKIKGMPYEYIVEDYGSALVGTDTIDLYKPSYPAMNQWGAREVGIEVLEWGSFEESRRILDSRKTKAGADHVRQMLKSIESKIDRIPHSMRNGFGA